MNHSSEHPVQGTCPFRQVSTLTPDELGASLYSVAKAFNTVQSALDSRVESCVGNWRLHPSAFNQDKLYPLGKRPLVSGTGTPMEIALGELHQKYRDLGKNLGGLLDEHALQPETRVAIKALDGIAVRYRKRVSQTRNEHGLPYYKGLPPDELRAFDQEIIAALTSLQKSELGTAATIPLKTSTGETLLVSNEDGLGMYLFVLGRSSALQIDANRQPQAQCDEYQAIVNATDKIIAGGNQRLNAIPQLQREIRKLYASAQDEILTHIRTHARPFQLMSLLFAFREIPLMRAVPQEFSRGQLISVQQQVVDSTRLICKTASIAPSLSRLETPWECAAVIEAIANSPQFLKEDGKLRDRARLLDIVKHMAPVKEGTGISLPKRLLLNHILSRASFSPEQQAIVDMVRAFCSGKKLEQMPTRASSHGSIFGLSS